MLTEAPVPALEGLGCILTLSLLCHYLVWICLLVPRTGQLLNKVCRNRRTSTLPTFEFKCTHILVCLHTHLSQLGTFLLSGRCTTLRPLPAERFLSRATAPQWHDHAVIFSIPESHMHNDQDTATPLSALNTTNGRRQRTFLASCLHKSQDTP